MEKNMYSPAGNKPKEESKIKPNEYEVMAQEILEIPYSIQATERKLIALSRKKDRINKQIDELKSKEYSMILYEVDADQKKRFSNDKMREIELHNRIKDNKEYVILVKEETGVIEHIQETKLEIDFLKRQFKSIQIVIEIAKVQYKIF